MSPALTADAVVTLACGSSQKQGITNLAHEQMDKNRREIKLGFVSPQTNFPVN